MFIHTRNWKLVTSYTYIAFACTTYYIHIGATLFLILSPSTMCLSASLRANQIIIIIWSRQTQRPAKPRATESTSANAMEECAYTDERSHCWGMSTLYHIHSSRQLIFTRFPCSSALEFGCVVPSILITVSKPGVS